MDTFQALATSGQCVVIPCRAPVTFASLCVCGRIFAACAEHGTYWGWQYSPVRAMKLHWRKCFWRREWPSHIVPPRGAAFFLEGR